MFQGEIKISDIKIRSNKRKFPVGLYKHNFELFDEVDDNIIRMTIVTKTYEAKDTIN